MKTDWNSAAISVARGRLTRRSFFSMAIASGISLALADSILKQALAATPKRGGLAKFGVSGGYAADSFDPAYAPSRYFIVLKRSVQNSLTEIDPRGEAVGDLAESWESTRDASQWTFKLRDGIEFHNGKSLTADDVVSTLNYHRAEKSTSQMKSLLGIVDDVRSDGKNVVITLKSANADIPYLLADYNLGIFPTTGDRIDWKTGIGTGGYILKKFQPGVQAELVRYPNYHKKDRAHFNEVSLVAINDGTARISALASGAMHAVDAISPKTAKMIDAQPQVRLVVTKGKGHYAFEMNLNMSPFDNNEVRTAIKLSCDREQFLKVILGGYGILGNDTPISPHYRYFAADIAQRTYDPEKAKFHLKKAGMENLKVKIHAAPSSFEGALDACALYRESAKKAGIDIEIVREPDDGYYTNVYGVKGWWTTWWGGRATIDVMMAAGYIKGAPWNATHFYDSRFEKLLREAAATLDDAKRRDLYREVQLIIRDSAGEVIPAFVNSLDGVSNKIGFEEQASSDYSMADNRAIERWWFI